jgi:hypothetical protein
MAEMNLGHVHLEPPFLGPWCIGCARGLLNDPMLTASQKVQLLRCAASFVTAAYSKYASFLRICVP